MKVEYNPDLIDLKDVPARPKRLRTSVWKQRFDDIPDRKAVLLRYNNRQRAYQVREAISHASIFWKVRIKTQIVHGEMTKHGTDDWLLYFWKVESEK